MKGAIFYSGKYGSTAQYAEWISEATGLPVFPTGDSNARPSDYDFVILGSSVIVFKLTNREWLKANWSSIKDKPILLFSVSGAPPGPKLDGWIADCLPADMLEKMERVSLRGRLDVKKVSLWDRLILTIGAWKNRDPKAKKDEQQGFDYMDHSSIGPILAWVQKQTEGGSKEAEFLDGVSSS